MLLPIIWPAFQSTSFFGCSSSFGIFLIMIIYRNAHLWESKQTEHHLAMATGLMSCLSAQLCQEKVCLWHSSTVFLPEWLILSERKPTTGSEIEINKDEVSTRQRRGWKTSSPSLWLSLPFVLEVSLELGTFLFGKGNRPRFLVFRCSVSAFPRWISSAQLVRLFVIS